MLVIGITTIYDTMQSTIGSKKEIKKMKRLKEKLKAIYHIIIDSEYIVFTVTMIDTKIQSSCAFTSDNASKIFVESAIIVLEKGLKKEENKQTKIKSNDI